ncbi:MAG: NUDIX domain-containing protein [Nanoarchaeota archaeon]
MRIAINALIIKNGKVLLVRKGETWILPGGKLEEGENDLQCLSREVAEELSGTKLCNVLFYGEFEGQTPHKKDILKARVYFADIDGELYGVRKGDSILEANWVDNIFGCKLSDITFKIITSLKREGYL